MAEEVCVNKGEARLKGSAAVNACPSEVTEGGPGMDRDEDESEEDERRGRERRCGTAARRLLKAVVRRRQRVIPLQYGDD